MTNFEKLIHLIRFGLIIQKIEYKEVIDWADTKIKEGSDDPKYLEICLAKDSNKIIEILDNNTKWNYNNPSIRKIILSYYNELLKSYPSSWPSVQYELMTYFDYLEFDDSNKKSNDFLYCLQDDYELRKSGFGGSLLMPYYLVENLSEYDIYGDLKNFLHEQRLHGFEI